MGIPLGKREQNKQANRAAILSAARRCFVRAGFDAVTIRDVIRETALAAGTFYNYFPDKEALFRELVDQHLGVLEQRIHVAREHATSVESFFYESYLGALQQVRTDPEFFAMMFRNEPVLRALYRDNIFGLMLRSLKDDLRQAIARGVLPQVDAEVLTAISFGAGYELCRLMAEQPQHDPQETARFITRLFLDGIGALQPQAATIRIGSRLLRGAAR